MLPLVDMEEALAHKRAVCAGLKHRRSIWAKVREAMQHHQHLAMRSSICSRWTPGSMLSDHQPSYIGSLFQFLGMAIGWSFPWLSLLQGQDLGLPAAEIVPTAERDRGRVASRESHRASPAGTLQSPGNTTQVKELRGCLHLGHRIHLLSYMRPDVATLARVCNITSFPSRPKSKTKGPALQRTCLKSHCLSSRRLWLRLRSRRQRPRLDGWLPRTESHQTVRQQSQSLRPSVRLQQGSLECRRRCQTASYTQWSAIWIPCRSPASSLPPSIRCAYPFLQQRDLHLIWSSLGCHAANCTCNR